MSAIMISDDGGDTMKSVDVGGFFMPVFNQTFTEIKDIFDNVPNFKCRDDDIMLCTYPKTGTNWCFEVLMMLLKKSAERCQEYKYLTMIEALTEAEIDRQPSPRIVNCHLSPRFLPRDMASKKTKTILCLRNPKDTAVSYYNHMKGLTPYEYTGKWENWLGPYVEGKLEYGSYPAYLNDWQHAIEKGLGYPLHIMYFEDMKANGICELEKLMKFLQIDVDDQLKIDIIDMCHFDKMANNKIPKEIADTIMRPGFNLYRKGQVGDWKNCFNVAQNEMFDATWKRDINGDSIFKFKYII